MHTEIVPGSTLRRTGVHPYGSRRYELVVGTEETGHNDTAPLNVVGRVCANRNIVFGAWVDETWHEHFGALLATPLHHALKDSASVGEQPQALSTLHGLSLYVQKCLNAEVESECLKSLRENNDTVVLEAIEAIATGIPRPGHKTVGGGTHTVAEQAWEALAKEFVGSIDHNTSDECRLFLETPGVELVGIELLADTNPQYLSSAGGSMARFVFM